MTGRQSNRLRTQLASAAGILLGPPSTRPAADPPAALIPPPPDREAVRAILVDAGAPARDLEWLVPSCPSLELAGTYRPPVREAWCARCDGPVSTDDRGCIPCREIAEAGMAEAPAEVGLGDGQALESDERVRRVPGCQCHQEIGDSPCPVHGDEDQR